MVEAEGVGGGGERKNKTEERMEIYVGDREERGRVGGSVGYFYLSLRKRMIEFYVSLNDRQMERENFTSCHKI